jgi:hypothetical protein
MKEQAAAHEKVRVYREHAGKCAGLQRLLQCLLSCVVSTVKRACNRYLAGKLYTALYSLEGAAAHSHR